MAMVEHQTEHRLANFPHCDASAAELVEMVQRRYETQGDFDASTVWEIVSRFAVAEGLAPGLIEGPDFIDTF